MSEITNDTERSGGRERQRFSIELDESHRASLAMIAKSFKITQGEVIEVMLDQMGSPTGDLAAAMTEKRAQKVASRAPKKGLYQQFKNLSPAQLEAALAAAQKVGA